MILDVISSLAGLVIPPAFDFIKNKFSRKTTTPQETLSSLAVTKPEVMPAFIEAQAKLTDAEVRLYNRDITQEVSRWVADLRGSIRPIFTVASIIIMIIAIIHQLNIDPALKQLMEITISSWFGDRLRK